MLSFKRITENIFSIILSKKILDWMENRKPSISKKQTKKLVSKIENLNQDWNSLSKYKK